MLGPVQCCFLEPTCMLLGGVFLYMCLVWWPSLNCPYLELAAMAMQHFNER